MQWNVIQWNAMQCIYVCLLSCLPTSCDMKSLRLYRTPTPKLTALSTFMRKLTHWDSVFMHYLYKLLRWTIMDTHGRMYPLVN